MVYRPKLANIMFKGYYRDPEATLATMSDLWFHTGDLGYVDHDGFFCFVDRKKDALRRRGENVSSQEVESALLLHPEVHEAAAVAVRSELGEDEVMAVLEVADAAAFDFETLFRHCDATMPHFMVHRHPDDRRHGRPRRHRPRRAPGCRRAHPAAPRRPARRGGLRHRLPRQRRRLVRQRPDPLRQRRSALSHLRRGRRSQEIITLR